MMIDYVLIPLTLLALAVASYCDLKTREVPDWLNYGLIVAALGTRVIFSFQDNWWVLLSGILGFLACFALACIFYYTNQWGGGDSKLLMGLGAVIGITLPLGTDSLNLFYFFIATISLGAVYGLIWMIVLALTHRKTFAQSFKDELNKYRHVHTALLVAAAVLLLTSIFLRFLWPISIFILVVFYLLIFVSAVEQHSFTKKIPLGKLTEGDWLAEGITFAGRQILPKKTITTGDLSLLRKLKERLKTVLIQEGIPFVPSFLFAYILLLLLTKNIFPLIWLVV